MAKAAFWAVPDAEMRKLGERTGLETPVVHAVNDASEMFKARKRRSGSGLTLRCESVGSERD